MRSSRIRLRQAPWIQKLRERYSRSVASRPIDYKNAPRNTFSVDLLAKSKEHLNFLRRLHREQELLSTPGRTAEKYYAVTKRSIHRYLNCWLPLVAEHPNEPLFPPHDVAWLWHCHRLAPQVYQKHTMSTYGRVLDPYDSFRFIAAGGLTREFVSYGQQATAVQLSEQYDTNSCWDQKYPNEPFLPPPPIKESDIIESFQLEGGFDLVASAHRQGSFLWQVSGSRFLSDQEFLKDAIKRYYGFLLLRKTNPDTPIVPTYQIDLVWHTHILCSTTKYSEDCIKIHGQELNHDDSLNNRTAGGRLDIASEETSKLWKKSYSEPFAVAGGMYRGEPPRAYFSGKWDPSRVTKEKNSNSGDHKKGDHKKGGGCGSSCGAPPINHRQHKDDMNEPGTGNEDSGGSDASCGGCGGCGG